MLKLVVLLISSLLVGCTPTVKEIALYKGKKDIVIVKKGRFLFSEEDRKFIRKEAERLGIPIPDRREIEHHLRLMLKNKRSMEIALKRANLYIPYIKPILREHGLPAELSLLPLIESGFNPFAVSKSGAGGVWQLMPSTARRYGLRVDRNLDERFDLEKSTRAAASYLKELHRRFRSWELVLAAYNCGEGCVSRRTKGRDFWRTKWALPEQTRKYVPMFFAALLIAKSPHRYGLNVDMDSLRIDRKLVRETTSVGSFVKRYGVKESTFRDLNPHIKGSYIPRGAYVYVPEGSYERPPTVRVAEVKPGKIEVKKLVKSKLDKKESRKGVGSKERKVARATVRKESRIRPVKVKKIAKAEKILKSEEPKASVKGKKKERKVVRLSVPKRAKPSATRKAEKARKFTPRVVVKKRRADSDRLIVVKRVGEPVRTRTKVITLENGAVLYIKE